MVKHTQTIRLSVFDHFAGLALKGLKHKFRQSRLDFANTFSYKAITRPAITCSDLKIETLERGVKYVQS